MNNWYLATSKPKQEQRAVENLENQGITAFSPSFKVEKIRAGKKTVVSEIMFTGYVFIQLTQDDPLWHKVKSTRGIRDWVRFATTFAQIPNQLVQQLMLDQQQTSDTVQEHYKQGDKVHLLDGPFAGLSGIYQASSGLERSIILLEFLGKTNRLKVDNSNLKRDNH
jgi:transcriptional antiterminator RfaH